MTENGDADPGQPDDPDADEDDRVLADLVGRIRRADDPTAALLRPLSAEQRQAMADRVISSLGPRPEVAAPVKLPRRRPRAAWIAPIAAALAIAASVMIWARPGPSLVAYRVDVEGDAEGRGSGGGAPGATVRLRPETKLRVRFAPAAPAHDVALRMIVVQGGKARVIAPPAMADGQGGFTIEVAAGALLGEQVDGPIELVFAVGRPLPDEEKLAAMALDSSIAAPASVRIERRSAVLVGFSPKHGSLGFSGCKGVREGPVCEVGRASPIQVWAEGSDADRFTVRIDDRVIPASAAIVEGGVRFRVDPPPGARVLSLALAGREVLHLPLEDAIERPLVDAAEALRRDGRLDEAEAALDEAERDPGARLAALRLRARIAHKRGDAVRAAALREEAIVQGRAAGRVSDEIDDEIARVFELLFTDDALGAARRRLDAIRPIDAGDAEDRVKLDYYRGLVAGEMGDLRTAIDALRAARIGARRHAVASYEAVVAAPLADVLSGLGRYDEAAGILAEMSRDLAATTDPCDRAQLVMNHGAILLRAGKIDEAGLRLDDAAKLAEGACPRVIHDVLINQAFARSEAGAAGEARALLARARAAKTGPDAWMEVWEDRLAIELALDSDPRAALAAADRVDRAGEASLSPELLFEAAIGRAAALDRLGDVAAAGRAYASAEQALDAWAALVPLGEGRQSFLDRQERAARGWIDFLHHQASRASSAPEPGLALARAARRSVGRFYRALGAADRAGALAADDGQVASIAAYHAARARIDAAIAARTPPLADDLAVVRDRQIQAGSSADPRSFDLAPPDPDEVALVYHPIADGWLGIAWTSRSVIARPLGRVDPTAGAVVLASALLEPFRDLLAGAARVRVHPHRALAGVAFHALPWDGGALLDHAQVIYGVDLPSLPARAAACSGAPTALIVADARLDLAAASAAARPLEAALRARGYAVQRLQGDEARLDSVRAALIDPCVVLFHYEGHAVFEGRDGVDAALILADGRLRAAEILALPRVPETAVLSGCSTAEADGLGLAHAFLARGAIEVLATAKPVDDATAARVGRLLYEPTSPAGDTPPRLAEGWKRVSARLRSESAPPKDLEAYRVLAR